VTVYPSLRDYAEIAADLLGTTPEQILRLPRIDLADSALAAPRAGFGGVETYPGLIESAAVLIEHLTRNHPLPDGNKRAAFLMTLLFLELNGLPLGPTEPDVDVPIVERIAAGEATRPEVEVWLRQRTSP
jgi:death-on-curing protein